MLVETRENLHRPKAYNTNGFFACVARSVPRKEARQTPKVLQALNKEWQKPIDKGYWDCSQVREWSVVASEAKRTNQKVRIGRVFDICIEKNHELPEHDPLRMYKGHVV